MALISSASEVSNSRRLGRRQSVYMRRALARTKQRSLRSHRSASSLEDSLARLFSNTMGSTAPLDAVGNFVEKCDTRSTNCHASGLIAWRLLLLFLFLPEQHSCNEVPTDSPFSSRHLPTPSRRVPTIYCVLSRPRMVIRTMRR